jgi:hypothetical protein
VRDADLAEVSPISGLNLIRVPTLFQARDFNVNPEKTKPAANVSSCSKFTLPPGSANFTRNVATGKRKEHQPHDRLVFTTKEANPKKSASRELYEKPSKQEPNDKSSSIYILPDF